MVHATVLPLFSVKIVITSTAVEKLSGEVHYASRGNYESWTHYGKELFYFIYL